MHMKTCAPRPSAEPRLLNLRELEEWFDGVCRHLVGVPGTEVIATYSTGRFARHRSAVVIEPLAHFLASAGTAKEP